MSEAEQNLLLEQRELLKEQNKLLKEQTQTLREMLAFWTKIVSDEYFNEMLKNDGVKFPK